MNSESDEPSPPSVSERVRRNWRDPRWWVGNVLPWAGAKAVEAVDRAYVEARRRRAVDVPTADWDTLLVLDACRYDTFARVNTVPGDLRQVRSKGSATSEWLGRNFYDRECHDTVYVTANPMHRVGEWVAPEGVDAGAEVLDGVFHDVIELWHDPDPELRTTPPEPVAEAALDAADRYPDKRLLVHFMQPHHPFIGPFARENGLCDTDFDRLREFAETGDRRERGRDAWERLRDGDYDPHAFVRAYEENLEIALPHVQRLVDALDGLTVVTSDHGNAMGERSPPFWRELWGHPPGKQTPELVDVPWLVTDPDAERRRTVAEQPVRRTTDRDDEAVTERLHDLGYV